MIIDSQLTPQKLQPAIDNFWKLSGDKILSIEKSLGSRNETPVFTVNGKYTTRGWTEWTQGFQYGSALLQFDATGEKEFLEIGRTNTIKKMAPHLTHNGVHDHGFNNVSTYGNLRRLMVEGKIAHNEGDKHFYELALKVSGAVQAMRWTTIKGDGGYVYSFNGPQSLFVDTVRSCRIMMISHLLGHVFQSENDVKISLLERAVKHLEATADYSVFYGEGRDTYDVSGRTAHECLFNVNDGNYRCPNSQQGFSGFTTWTRGLAWAVLGFAEELEFIDTLSAKTLGNAIDKKKLMEKMLKAAIATSDFYIANTATDGIPYWDTGAPGLAQMGDYLNTVSNPYNDHEPIRQFGCCHYSARIASVGELLKTKRSQEITTIHSGGTYSYKNVAFRTLLVGK